MAAMAISPGGQDYPGWKSFKQLSLKSTEDGRAEGQVRHVLAQHVFRIFFPKGPKMFHVFVNNSTRFKSCTV